MHEFFLSFLAMLAEIAVELVLESVWKSILALLHRNQP
jgi:hypothetical protein